MIYLDNAATTLRKPSCVIRAVEKAMRYAANAGRGGYSGAGLSEQILFDCRSAAAELFGVKGVDNVVFTLNATHALNIAINSVIQPKMKVLISGYEHNAVSRPLYARYLDGVKVTVVRGELFEPEYFLYELEKELERGADAVCCTHVSNVFGYILPIERVDELCARYGVPLIIDASQSAGSVPLNCSEFKAAQFVGMPGHKGLLGPQGTGILLCLADKGEPIMFGGTGADSKNRYMPEYLPERLEAGTQNVHGIAGLAEGIKTIKNLGVENIARYEKELIKSIIKGLELTPKVKLYYANALFCQNGVVSFNVRDADSEQVASELEKMGIAVRAGFHCAPLAHESAGTISGGTVRISVSPFTTRGEIGKFVYVLKKLTEILK